MIDIQRVKRILTSPKTEWPVIDGEPATIGGIVRNYLGWLALVSVLAEFVRGSLIGYGGMGFHLRVGVGAGILRMIVSFVLILVGAYVLSRIVDWLAPKFGGTANPLAAFKLVTYGATAALLGGVVGLVPWLGFLLALAAGIYSIYLVYLGLPVMMKCAPDRAPLFTLAVFACGFVVNLVIGGIAGLFLPSASMHGGQVSISTPRGDVTIESGKLEEMGRRLEEMGKRIEQADKSGDPDAVAKATREAVTDMAKGTGGRTPVEPGRLKALLPETLGGMKRGNFEAESRSAMGLNMSSAKATYQDGARSLKLEIIDPGSAAGLVSGVAGWANVLVDRETDTSIEKTYREGDRVISLHVQKDGSRAEYKLLLPNGIVVDAHGRAIGIDEVRKLVGQIDLADVASAH